MQHYKGEAQHVITSLYCSQQLCKEEKPVSAEAAAQSSLARTLRNSIFSHVAPPCGHSGALQHMMMGIN